MGGQQRKRPLHWLILLGEKEKSGACVGWSFSCHVPSYGAASGSIHNTHPRDQSASWDESSQLQSQWWTRMQPLLSTPSLKRHCLIASQLILSNALFVFALDQLVNDGVTLWTWPSLILLQSYPPACRRKLLLWRWLSDLMEYLSSSFSKLWNILSTKSAWRYCISLFFPTRLLLYSFRYEDPCLVLSLKSRCPSLFPFLLDSFCILCDMKIHVWNTDLLYCPWSLVAPLSFPSCSSPSVIFLIWRSISGTPSSCIVLEVSLHLSLFPFLLVSICNLSWYEDSFLEH